MVDFFEKNTSLIRLIVIFLLSFTTCSDSGSTVTPDPEPEPEEPTKGILVFSKTNEFRHNSIPDGPGIH